MIAVAFAATLTPTGVHAEIIDRILAVVNGALIMQTDVSMATIVAFPRHTPHVQLRKAA